MSNAKDRTWIIDGPPITVSDNDELEAAVVEATNLLNRVGGAILIVAQREQVAEDMWHTVGFAFRWSSYVPAKRREPDPEPEAMIEQEPVAVG